MPPPPVHAAAPATLETPPGRPPPGAPADARLGSASRLRPRRPDPLAAALAAVLTGGLALRLWSIGHGLPWAYNFDEQYHFVPKAVAMLGGSADPNYFENPPALTYVLYGVYGTLAKLGILNVGTGYRADPSAAFLVARVVVALAGTAAAGLAYRAGARIFGDRRVGLVAATLLAFAFLPVLYSKLALNDALTLVPVTVALVGCVLALERGRPRDWALAGAAIGAAAATKYTAGAMFVAVVAVAALRLRSGEAPARRTAAALAGAAAAAAAAFLLLNPYALLELGDFRSEVATQLSDGSTAAKVGQEDVPGWLYYAWTLTWGLGAIPALAAVAGGWLAFRWDARRALVLVVFPLVLLALLGAQARWFGRWLLPAYPMLALLAAFACVRAADRLPPAGRPLALAAITVLLAGQGLVSGLRVSDTLAEPDTRALARAWLAANVPAGSRVVIEPAFPRRFFTLGDRAGPPRYRPWPTRPAPSYALRLEPGLLGRYRAQGFCTVVTSSHQRDRALKARLAGATAYYAALDAASARAAVFSPWRAGADPPGFNFDLSFNTLPREHVRPGPLIEVRRLRGCTPRTA